MTVPLPVGWRTERTIEKEDAEGDRYTSTVPEGYRRSAAAHGLAVGDLSRALVRPLQGPPYFSLSLPLKLVDKPIYENSIIVMISA